MFRICDDLAGAHGPSLDSLKAGVPKEMRLKALRVWAYMKPFPVSMLADGGK